MTIIFSDTFTAASDQNLEAHTPDVGTSWAIDFTLGAAQSYQVVAASDTMRCPTASSTSRGVVYVANPASTPPDNNYEVMVKCAAVAGVSTDAIVTLYARYTDNSNHYGLLVYPTFTGGWFELFKVVGGTVTSLTSIAPGATITAGQEIRLSVQGSTIKAFRDSTEILSWSDSAITAIGKGGICLGALSWDPTRDWSTAFLLDDFKINTLVVVAGTPDNLGHTKSRAININQGTVVSGPHSNLPVLLTEACLPLDMFDADGTSPAQNGGGDIRFSANADGTSLVPLEVISFVTNNNPALGTARLWVKWPITNAPIYVWYNTPNTDSQPAVGLSNGRNAVWADYVIASHDLITDSKGVSTLTATGTVAATGPFGNASGAKTFGGVSTDKVTTNYTAHNAQRTYQIWAYRTGDGGGNLGALITKGSVEAVQHSLASTAYYVYRGFSGGSAFWNITRPATGAWRFVSVTYNLVDATSDPLMYLDGVVQTTTDTNTTGTSTNDATAYVIGNRASDNARAWHGQLAEFRMYNGIRSAGWLATEFANQNSPGTFAAAAADVGSLIYNPMSGDMMSLLAR